ncbi:MAG TPA: hydantoinase/oxoprolinase family protein, partial [Anaerolineales bacterium]|nr:hydantoinase/oxoprolinase family protein [Anaerolineales bacterium]
MASDALLPLRIGIDTGGTFTDFVVFDPTTGALTTFKLPSTPENPALAVLEGIAQISKPANEPTQSPHLQITHGSTVATNALLERKGARTALITTRGFRDVLAIGRQNRPILYDLTPTLPPPLVPDDLRFEVTERVDSQGQVLTSLSETEIKNLLTHFSQPTNQPTDQPIPNSQSPIPNIESIAICLLFSFLHPEHEQRLAETLRAAGYFVSASHEILPEYREYERTATTVVNAYVSPIMDRYLGQLEETLANPQENTHPSSLITLHIMQSNGGLLTPAQARREAVRCILSGPAGGIVAAQNLPHESASQLTNHPTDQPINQSPSSLLTFDMG